MSIRRHSEARSDIRSGEADADEEIAHQFQMDIYNGNTSRWRQPVGWDV